MEFPKDTDVSAHMASRINTARRRRDLSTNHSSATQVMHVQTVQ